MFGDTIDLIESLQITLLGMSVVFLVLVLLMGIIKIMEKAVNRDVTKQSVPVKEPVAEKITEAPTPATQNVQGDDTELIAVIAAAAASCMGVAPSDLIIKNIVRMPETAPIWSLSGRSDLMASRQVQ